MKPSLPTRLTNGESGLCFYGMTPPKRGQAEVKLREIAERQIERIRTLEPDGLVLYDLQEETGRSGTERPFPFLPTMEPRVYARDFLGSLPIPKIFYKCVSVLDPRLFSEWLDANPPGTDAYVLVGAPTSETSSGLSLSKAYDLLRDRREIVFGGIAIAERHARKNDEEERLWMKHSQGCRFFISQTIYDVSATKSLLSDYALRFARARVAPPPFILSFSPCGSPRTMDFMKWLGISFPRWLENELRYSENILAKSVDLAEAIFADLKRFAEEKKIPIGMNVESVSIRKDEIDASCELFARLSKILGPRQGF